MCTNYGTLKIEPLKVVFYKTVQLGWSIGMPVVRKLDKGLWEIRTELQHKISRVLFTIFENQKAYPVKFQLKKH